LADFTIFIDETGNFSYGNDPKLSFIGGWVCRGTMNSEDAFNTLLETQVTNFNNSYPHSKLEFPADMHFMPLHISSHPDQIKPFFTDVFNEIKRQTCFVFRSTGIPTIIPHAQAAYFEVLRNTLVQLVEDEFFPQKFSLQIVIAFRRKKELYGFANNHPQSYEKYLTKVLLDELEQSSQRKVKPNIDISFADARQHSGLILADFFCGAQKKELYLNDYNHKIYHFSHGYRVFPEIIDELQFIREDAPISAFMRGAQILSCDPQNQSLRKLLKETFSEIIADRNDKEYFFTTLKNHLDLILIENSSRYRNLDEAESLIKLCQEYGGSDSSQMDPEELKLKAVFNLHKIRIASHRGKISLQEIVNHFNFLKGYHEKIFKNRLEYLQYKIDSILIMVQVAAFNTLQFDTVSQHLQPIVDEYDKRFGDLAESGVFLDENRAKLKGTIGQMYAFQYDLTKNQKLYFSAEQSLREDVNACLEKSNAWKQGMGYLTTLYWHKGELKKATDQFLAESGFPDAEKEIFDLSKEELFGSIEQRPFIFLHRLYLCALAQERKEVEVCGIDQCKHHLLLQCDRLNRYPEFLSIKWLAVLLMQANDYSAALELLELILNDDRSQGFTLDFIRLPVKLLKHKCLIASGGQSDFLLDGEIKKLEKLQSGSTEILEKLGIERFRNNPKQWNPYEVGLLMPFYYA